MKMREVLPVFDVIEKAMSLEKSTDVAASGIGSARVDAWAFQRETLLVVWSEGRICYVSPMDDSLSDSAWEGSESV